ncbi:MAG: hypothetical protein GVY20_13635 [Bacteroidetes bacterium]|jgi:hypothetical protein|nr:hypothetical protein [Bacteroidota bacterium]
MKITGFLFLFVLFILTSSCCEDAETIRFGEIENQFLPYEINDTLRYKNLQTEDVIELIVYNKYSEIFEESDGEGPYGLRGFCTRSEDSYEEKTIELESENCFMEYSVSVSGNPAGVRFSIGNCEVSSYGTTISNGQDLIYQDGTYMVEDVVYEPVYQLNNSTYRVLFTPGIGILSFIDEESGDEYVFVQ